MTCKHGIYAATTRSLAFLIAASLFAGCAGASHLLPSTAGPGSSPVDAPGGSPSMSAPGAERVTVQLSIRIPHRDRRTHDRHPATISALTQSVGIAIDGAAAKVFNTMPSSPGCSIGAKGTTCTFAVAAKAGTDTFVATTYSSIGGGGTPLDRGVATVPITKGKANTVPVTLGPVVSTTADSGVGSLRYAVATANFGDTIMFLLPSGSNIALASPIVVEGGVVIAGPGAKTPITISGGNAHQLFFIGGAATISGLTFTQGKAPVSSAPGGAIANTGSLTLANDTFNGNSSIAAIKRGHRPHMALNLRRHPHCSTTTNEGGALYNAGTLVITGTTFNGNVVANDTATCIQGAGGAIYNDQTGTISSSGDTFTNNAAAQGGAVFNAGAGQATFTNDTFTGNTGCTAAIGCPTSCTSSACTAVAEGIGAAIFDEGGVTISSSTFTNNVAGGATSGSTGQGGAIALGAGNPTITGSTFTGNLAGGGTAGCSTGTGGAIYAVVPLVLTNDTFASNRAVGDQTSIGGAVSAMSSLDASGSTFKGNQTVGSGSVCNVQSQAIGGAIFAGSATLNGNTFTSNGSTGASSGGAGAVGCIVCYATGNTFTSNTAVGTGAGGATTVTGAGGAMYGENMVKLVNNTFTSNSSSISGPNAAAAYAGAVLVTAGPVSSSGDTFASNSAKDTGTGIAAGGGVVMTSGTAILSHDTFTSNTAAAAAVAAGGGGYLSGTVVLDNTIVSNNHTTGGTQGLGGGIAAMAGEYIRDTFTHNTVTATTGTGTGAGGGLYNNGSAEIESSTFSQNTASSDGGGLLTGGGDTLIDTTITGNAVTSAIAVHEGGGGLFAGGSIDVEQSTIANNSVTIGGAGSSGGGGIYTTGPLNLAYSTVSTNVVLGNAATSGGGGIYSGDAVTVQDSTISNNTAKSDGGGIYIGASATVTIENATLFKNVAGGSGGNIINPYTITLTNSIVAGGTAASGADVKNTGTLTSGDYNIIQTAIIGNAPMGTTTHNKTADPLLLALSNNGGATFTNADQSTSPGKAYIPYAAGNCGTVALATDQRGYARGAGGHCDAGAFELAGVPQAARRPVRHHPPASSARAIPGLHLQPIRLHLIPLNQVL